MEGKKINVNLEIIIKISVRSQSVNSKLQYDEGNQFKYNKIFF